MEHLKKNKKKNLKSKMKLIKKKYQSYNKQKKNIDN